MKRVTVIENKGRKISQDRIDKEEIRSLHFPRHEVLLTRNEMFKRFHDLNNSTIIGNCHQSKVNIVFEDIEGPKKVYTTIWKVTDEEVFLKDNIIIPIHRIVKILHA